jgi:two-component system, LytTR family, sensor histidine kinase AlgZ
LGILSQNAASDALPDFRNLGVMARVLVLVHMAVLIAAAVKATDLGSFIDAFVSIALLAEPLLLAALVLLYALSPFLARVPYPICVAAIFVVVTALTIGISTAVRAVDASPGGFLRESVFALLLTAFVITYLHLRNRAFSPALAEARLQALQARIRPHFLFNSLNAVLSLIRTEPRQAERALEDLAELYRMLMIDTRTLVTLARELEVTRQYLRLEQLRLGKRLRIDWHVDNAPLDAMVPPLLLQPLVENAVYHGIEPGIGTGIIEIGIAREKDLVRVRLSNPYHVEHQHRQGNRMALANIRERLALHFDVEGKMESRVVGAYYETRIDMPYRRAVR